MRHVSASVIPSFPQLWQKHLVDGVVRDHMAGRGFVDFQAKRAFANFLESGADACFIFPHRIGVGQARSSRVVLRLAETTVVAPHEDLHLFASATVPTK